MEGCFRGSLTVKLSIPSGSFRQLHRKELKGHAQQKKKNVDCWWRTTGRRISGRSHAFDRWRAPLCAAYLKRVNENFECFRRGSRKKKNGANPFQLGIVSWKKNQLDHQNNKEMPQIELFKLATTHHHLPPQLVVKNRPNFDFHKQTKFPQPTPFF